MGRTGVFTKALATVGVVLAWFPIAITLAVALVRLAADQRFRVDYLMPAELFPVAVAGSGLLWWAALRARSRRRVIGWGLAAMLALLVGGQALAVATGLASGATEPAGWPWALAVASIAGYTLALIVVAAAGALLVRDVYLPSVNAGAAGSRA